MPILPGLTDRESDLELLAQSARTAGAQWFAAGVLWLMPASRDMLFPFLDQKFPKLARTYRRWYTQASYAPQHYREEIALRVSRVRARYRLGNRPYFHPLPAAALPAPREAQLSLALPAAS
jgi:DNA repair photolyase